MSSQERIEANRANALHSTGPATPKGKARASRNSLKHGLLSREVVLGTEDRAEFEAFRDGLVADLAPEGDLEAVLAERIAGQWWRLKRVARMEAKLIERDEGTPDASGAGGALGGAGGALADAGDALADAGDALAGARDALGGAGDALAASLGAKYCPYETLRRYERAIERGLDGSMRQFREAQKLRAQRQAAQAREDREQSRYEELRGEYSRALRSRENAIQEVIAVRTAAIEAGVKIGKSFFLEELGPDWLIDQAVIEGRAKTSADGVVSQRGAEGAPRPAEGPEEQRYGRDREE